MSQKKQYQPVKTALFGFGTVGQGVHQIICEQQLPFQIEKICVRDSHKLRKLPAALFTFNPSEILEDPSIEYIVEAISESEPAFEIVSRAIKAGKQVVTANKKMVAEHLPALLNLLLENPEANLRYEGAVGGAIPVLHNLDTYFAHEPIHEIRAILNGSSNYILTKIIQEGLTYGEALRQAQEKGFAEADPTLDVSGRDAVNKLCIIAYHAFGKSIHPDQVKQVGINQLKTKDFELAAQSGQKIKQVVRLQAQQDGQLEVSVKPEKVSASDPLYHVDQEFNTLVLEGAFSGTQQFTGKGAGKLPTGTAVVSDLLALLDGETYGFKKAGIEKVKVLG